MQKNEDGFTLVELMIAIFLLSVGLLAAAGMQAMALRSNTHANIHTTSTMVAQQVMDDLMSVELLPNSTVPNIQYWYTQFNQGTGNNSQAYNRFPPINTLGSVPTGTTSLQINDVGTFAATYTLIPNTPTQFVTQVQVGLTLNGQPTYITLTGYRSVPQQ